MSYKKILTIQDISCVGQCSLTVALPILSAAGHETCILPSAVLSNHTGGFRGYTFRDLTGDIPKIAAQWREEGISFDAVYTGYLGSAAQIGYVKDIIATLAAPGAVTVVDPAMADNGRLYAGFDASFVAEMKKFAVSADIILPNITEACLLTGVGYRESYDGEYIASLLAALRKDIAGTVILTGVSYSDDVTGIVVLEGDEMSYYTHRKSPRSSHGTGDVFAAAFVGAYVSGKSAYESAGIAGEYTLRCIENTVDDPGHWYGVKFEPVLGYYIDALKAKPQNCAVLP